MCRRSRRQKHNIPRQLSAIRTHTTVTQLHQTNTMYKPLIRTGRRRQLRNNRTIKRSRKQQTTPRENIHTPSRRNKSNTITLQPMQTNTTNEHNNTILRKNRFHTKRRAKQIPTQKQTTKLPATRSAQRTWGTQRIPTYKKRDPFIKTQSNILRQNTPRQPQRTYNSETSSNIQRKGRQAQQYPQYQQKNCLRATRARTPTNVQTYNQRTRVGRGRLMGCKFPCC